MPQILRYPFDSVTVTVDASTARLPTAVVLPRRGNRSDEADAVLVTPKTNEGRFAWDGTQSAALAVASSHLVPAGATATLPIPRTDRADLKRHCVVLDVATALADGETLTISDGTNTIVAESDAGNNGVAGGSTEIGTNASTDTTQAAGLAALINNGTIDIWASVDAEDTSRVVLLAETAEAVISITGASSSTSGDVTTIDCGTGVVTVTDYGRERPILYVLSETTSTAISVSTVGY